MSPSAVDPTPVESKSTTSPPKIARFDAKDPNTTCAQLVEVLHRDGGVIVENLITPELAAQIKTELKPYFDTDRIDKTGFFPETTQRASGLISISPGCIDYLTTPLLIEVANAILTSTYSFWIGEKQRTVVSKPQISSTAGFRVNPGGRAQALHRDDAFVSRFLLMVSFQRKNANDLTPNSDYHSRNVDFPVLLGCVAALTKTTAENGATVVIPGSHNWGTERAPLEHEAIPAELEIGSALIFFGNTYHAGGANKTTDSARETVGMFLTKGYLRQSENQYLMVPIEKARPMSNEVKRLLGYGKFPFFSARYERVN